MERKYDSIILDLKLKLVGSYPSLYISEGKRTLNVKVDLKINWEYPVSENFAWDFTYIWATFRGRKTIIDLRASTSIYEMLQAELK